MFYCYMNDEIVNINHLCYICKKKCFCFIFQHTLHVFPPIVTVYWFKGRPQIMVYPPRNTPCHVYLYVFFLVDHDLRSTHHALFSTYVIYW